MMIRIILTRALPKLNVEERAELVTSNFAILRAHQLSAGSKEETTSTQEEASLRLWIQTAELLLSDATAEAAGTGLKEEAAIPSRSSCSTSWLPLAACQLRLGSRGANLRVAAAGLTATGTSASRTPTIPELEAAMQSIWREYQVNLKFKT